VDIDSPGRAQALGIGMVFQHFNLFDTLTVAENIWLGMDRSHPLDDLHDDIRSLSRRYGLKVDPHRHVHQLSIGERQRVEILRALVRRPTLLIMDEPTSVLTPQEAERLFETLRQLAGEGCSILYISHKLDEIRSLCDRATVLRRGRVVATCDPRAETRRSLAEMMIGRALPVCRRDPRREEEGEVRLAVRRLSVASPDPHGIGLKSISFELRGGEILGIAGVAGNGQKELLAALNGELLAPATDMVILNGRPAGRLGPAARRASGLAFVPEERLGRGAVPDMSLADNTVLTGDQHGMVRGGVVDTARARERAAAIRDRFAVVWRDVDVEARSLSGGNLQKFIMGREISLAPDVLLLGHPTWGVDVGAAATIHQAIIDLAQAGTAVLLVSEDLDEIFAICDTVAVIAEGRPSPRKPVVETGIEEVGLWMSGHFPDEAADAA